MPIDIDGYAVLGAISKQRHAFAAIRNEVSKTARSLVVKQLKEKTLTLANLKAISAAIEHDSLDLILDLMSETEIKSLLSKIDQFNTEAKSATPQAQRKQILGLAKGVVSPAAKPVVVKPATAPRQAKPQVERAVNSRAMRAKQKV
jgi:hypothetical protein